MRNIKLMSASLNGTGEFKTLFAILERGSL